MPAGGLAARAVNVRRVARLLLRGSARPSRARRRDFVTNRHDYCGLVRVAPGAAPRRLSSTG
jgi:hypothetical protein